MIFAYADPPYIGCANLYPEKTEVDHEIMIALLDSQYDAWALSCSSVSLQYILSMCPRDVRVGAWVKPFCSFKKGVNPAYAWEPVIFSRCRKRGKDEHFVRDYISAMPPIFQGTARSNVKGQKPTAFSFWLFAMLGAQPGDTFHDIFPGSNAVGDAWNVYQGQFEFLEMEEAEQLPLPNKSFHSELAGVEGQVG